MTDPLSLGIAAVSATVATALGWLYWPRPPALDGERWFKLGLATALRGSVEVAGGDAAAWERAVGRFVLYNPAGRQPERKVSFPAAVALPGAALPGEAELLTALAELDGLSARWARMYEGDLAARAARLADPNDLGPAYDFARWLPLVPKPAETGWDLLATWPDGRFATGLALGFPARWIAVEGRPRPGVPRLVPALAEVVALERIAWPATDLAARLAEGTGRLVLIGEEAGITAILRALVDLPEVRDRIAAVVAIGGIIGGDPAESGLLSPSVCGDWLGANFAHHVLDTERVRFTPYLSVGWLDRASDPPGAGGLSIAAQRFPEVRQDPGVVPTLETVDLGLLPADPELPVALVARALVAVVAAMARTRGA